MEEKELSLTGGEWNVMECLWAHAPATGREVADALRESVGWSRTTALTMLSRMTKKGLVRCDDREGLKKYSPLVDHTEAVERETSDFVKRVYKGSVSLLMSAVTEKQELSDAEIDQLYAILDRMKEERT